MSLDSASISPVSRLAERSEVLADSLARGALMVSRVSKLPASAQLGSDVQLLANSSEVSRKVLNALRLLPNDSPFQRFRELHLPVLRIAAKYVDAVSGGSALLATFAAERQQASKFFPQTLFSAGAGVLHIAGSVSAAKLAGGATAGFMAAILGGLGVGATGIAIGAASAATAAATLTAYAVGKSIAAFRQAAADLIVPQH